jgi:hypothetical protein
MQPSLCFTSGVEVSRTKCNLKFPVAHESRSNLMSNWLIVCVMESKNAQESPRLVQFGQRTCPTLSQDVQLRYLVHSIAGNKVELCKLLKVYHKLAPYKNPTYVLRTSSIAPRGSPGNMYRALLAHRAMSMRWPAILDLTCSMFTRANLKG